MKVRRCSPEKGIKKEPDRHYGLMVERPYRGIYVEQFERKGLRSSRVRKKWSGLCRGGRKPSGL